jgi:hypothetical protein
MRNTNVRRMLRNMTNREQLRHFLECADISQLRAAELLAAQMQRPCSVRTIRAWLADPTLPSARPCPDWALTLLRTILDQGQSK